jgi:hypothetical protein
MNILTIERCENGYTLELQEDEIMQIYVFETLQSMFNWIDNYYNGGGIKSIT